MADLIDMTGQRYGMLTVIEKAQSKHWHNGAFWRCRCDCGKERVVRGYSLRIGETISCGCTRRKDMELIYIKNDPNYKKKSFKSIPCPYNEGCHCKTKDCWRCGWNPKVAEVRRARMEAGHGN